MTDNIIDQAIKHGLVLEILKKALEQANISTDDVVAELCKMGYCPLDIVEDGEIEKAYEELHPDATDWEEIVRQASAVAHHRGSAFSLFESVRLLREEFKKLNLTNPLAVSEELL